MTTRSLVLILLVVAAFSATARTQDLECSTAETVTKGSPAIFSLDPQGTRSIRVTTPMGSGKWDAVFDFGEGNETSFTPRIELDLRKVKPTSTFYQMKFHKSNPTTTTFLNQRIYNAWLDDGKQATMYVSESTFSIAFQNGEKKLLLQLTDPEIEGLEAVQVYGNLEVEECKDPEPITESTTTSPTTTTEPTTEPTTTTTEVPTTTTTTTTTSTTPVTTTTSPTSTTSTTTTTEAPTTVQDATTTTTSTTTSTTSTTKDSSAYTCLPTEDSESGTGGTTVCTPSPTESVRVLGVSEECPLPWWVWAVAGVAVALFVFILLLMAYSIALYRRSWNSGSGLKNNKSGGFGMSAQDMYYYEMKDANLMIGNTVPRIKTPRPSPGATPRNSTSRFSHNYSSSPSPTPNTLHLPHPDLGDSVSDITDHKDRPRNSKVSFADEVPDVAQAECLSFSAKPQVVTVPTQNLLSVP